MRAARYTSTGTTSTGTNPNRANPSRDLILLADDDGPCREALRRSFEAMGLRVQPYPTCDGALRFPQARRGEVMAVVMDYAFAAGRSGNAAVEAVGRRFAGIPAVLLSSDVSRASVASAQAHGLHFVPKPMAADALAAMIRHLCTPSGQAA